MEKRMKKQKDLELETQSKKYEKVIEDLKRGHKEDKAYIEQEFNKKIAELEEQLKIARSGFDAER